MHACRSGEGAIESAFMNGNVPRPQYWIADVRQSSQAPRRVANHVTPRHAVVEEKPAHDDHARTLKIAMKGMKKKGDPTI
jgi:hypothetical protein